MTKSKLVVGIIIAPILHALIEAISLLIFGSLFFGGMNWLGIERTIYFYVVLRGIFSVPIYLLIMLPAAFYLKYNRRSDTVWVLFWHLLFNLWPIFDFMDGDKSWWMFLPIYAFAGFLVPGFYIAFTGLTTVKLISKLRQIHTKNRGD